MHYYDVNILVLKKIKKAKKWNDKNERKVFT